MSKPSFLYGPETQSAPTTQNALASRNKLALWSSLCLLILFCCGCDALKAIVNQDRESMIRNSGNSAITAEAPQSSTIPAAEKSSSSTTDPWGDGYDFNNRVANATGTPNSSYDSSGSVPPGYPSPSYKPIDPANLPTPNLPPPGTPSYSSPPSYPGGPEYPTSPGLPTTTGLPTTPGYPGLPNTPGLPQSSGLPYVPNIPPPSSLLPGSPTREGIVPLDSDLTDFSGHWVLLRIYSDGEEQSPDIKDRAYKFSADSWSLLLSPEKRVSFTLKPEHEPKRIDIEDADRNLHLGIYKIENNRLIICYNNRSLRRPTSFEPENNRDLVQMEFAMIPE